MTGTAGDDFKDLLEGRKKANAALNRLLATSLDDRALRAIRVVIEVRLANAERALGVGLNGAALLIAATAALAVLGQAGLVATLIAAAFAVLLLALSCIATTSAAQDERYLKQIALLGLQKSPDMAPVPFRRRVLAGLRHAVGR